MKRPTLLGPRLLGPRLLGIGGAHIDRRGVMSADYIYGASIPGTMIEETGGGVFNALRAAVQFQVNAALISVRGGDAAGAMVEQELQRTGIADLSSVFLDRTTASYTALLARNGDVVAALADMSIYETALPRQISRRKTRDAIATSDAILIDANMPQYAIMKLMQQCAGRTVYALAISPAKVVRLRPVLSQLSCLFLNHREARALLGIEQTGGRDDGVSLMSQLVAQGIRGCVLTDGTHDVSYAEDAQIAIISPPKVLNVVDVTGAGDALSGATIAGLMNQMPLRQALQQGLAAAAITVQSECASADLSDKGRLQQMLAQTH